MSEWLDLSNSSNKLKQTYVSGFVDISGQGLNIRNGSLQIYDNTQPSNPEFIINSNSMNIYDGVSSYYDVSNSKLIYLKDVSENIQNRLDNLISRTQHITTDLTNNSVSIDNNLSVSGNTTIGSDLLVKGTITGNIKIGGNTSINNDLAIGGNANVGGTILSNGIITNGHILPANSNSFNLGSESSPFNSLYVNKGAIYFTDSENGPPKTTGTISFDPPTGSLLITPFSTDPTIPPLPPSIAVVSVGGNVGLGKTSPTFTLDVSGTSNLAGTVILNNKIYIDTDVSINSNLFVSNDTSLNGNLYVASNSLIDGRLTVSGDVSMNSNVTINNDLVVKGNLIVQEYTQNNIINTLTTNIFSISEDLSLNGNLLINGDASFSNDVTIAGNLITNYPANSIPQSAIEGGVGGIYIPTEVTTFDGDMFALVKEFHPGHTILDASVNGNLSISGSSKLQGNVIISNDLTVNGHVLMNSDVSFSNDVTITGNLITNYPAKSIPITAIQGNISDLGGGSFYTPTEVTTFDGDQFALLKEFTNASSAATDASVKGNLTVGNNVYLQSNIFVGGDLSMAGNIHAQTQPLTDNSDKIATTAYVQNTLFRQFMP